MGLESLDYLLIDDNRAKTKRENSSLRVAPQHFVFCLIKRHGGRGESPIILVIMLRVSLRDIVVRRDKGP